MSGLDDMQRELVRLRRDVDMLKASARSSVRGIGYVSAYATGTTVVGSGVWWTVNLAGTVVNDGNFGANVYTCPLAGRYLFAGAVWFSAAGAGLVGVALYDGAALAVNGSSLTIGAGAIVLPVAAVLDCAAGDVITLKAFAAAGGTVGTGAGNTYLTGQIL